MHKLATAVEVSKNSKLGRVSATYAAQQSCPRACPFLNNGCYAEGGPMRFTTHRLNKAARARKAGHLAVARAEAAAIRRLSGTRPLRVHTVGDCRTDEAAQIVSQAIESKGFPAAWSYTHSWRDVRRSSWGSVSILASCETLQEVRQARHRGYAAMLVVDRLPADGRAFMAEGVKVIPCPEQTRGVKCSECRLCFRDGFLKAAGAAIAVEAHGSRAEKVREVVKHNGGLVQIG
jgi:hypothetical protein